MAQKIQTTLIDDLDPELEATGTVAFALDGSGSEPQRNRIGGKPRGWVRLRWAEVRRASLVGGSGE